MNTRQVLPVSLNESADILDTLHGFGCWVWCWIIYLDSPAGHF